MKQLLTFLSIASTLGLMSSCKSDFELNAPYDEIPIIFGVMDASSDTHYVKINKSFIGDGNNIDYAGINDSTLYTDVAAYVDELVDDYPVNTFPLYETWIGGIEEGIFYEDSQKIYYFVTNGLNEDATYRLSVNTAEEANTIRGETQIIKEGSLAFDHTTFILGTLSGVRFATTTSMQTGVYNPVKVKWSTAPRAKRYELKMRFNYLEVDLAGVSTAKYLDWDLGTQVSSTSTGGGSLFRDIQGEAFYDMVDNKLSGYADEANVLKRIPLNLDFILHVGDEDLNTYIELQEPGTGVVTERPSFTNMSEGAGIFVSKTKIEHGPPLDKHSMRVLVLGATTSAYKFCLDGANDPDNYLTTYPDMGCQ